MGKPDSPAKEELKKGPWTREEDQKLLAYIEEHGHGSWRSLPAKAGLQRCGKSCRLRWTNYLRPDIKRGKFSAHEEKAIIRLHALLGNRWSAIATHLPKRTDNEIKNYWNTRLKKRLTRMGIDPVTHKPKSSSGGGAQSKQAANLSHMAQWETARLEAEARLVRESKILSNLQFLQKVTIPPLPSPPSPFQMSNATPCLDVLKVWQATAANSCFFGAQTTLESPTSTLNFSPVSAVAAVPTVTPSAGSLYDNHATTYEMDLGRFHFPDAAEDAGVPSISSDCYTMSSATAFLEQDDTKSYWNELLHMVTSPMELPGF